MNKKHLFLVFAFLPIIEQLFVRLISNYFIGLFFRLVVLVGFPLWYSIRNRIKIIAIFKKVRPPVAIYCFSLGYGAIAITYFIARPFIDNTLIIEGVSKLYTLTIPVYLIVGLLISFLNPFIEEFFWRGFIFRNFRKSGGSILIGSLFSMHHIVILWDWLSVPLLIFVTVALAGVGIFLSYLYRRFDSIFPPLLCHMGADMAIITIGYFMFF